MEKRNGRKKRIRIEPPLEAADPNEEIHEERYDFNHLPHEILEMFFKHLNGKDLSSVAMVCRNWLKSANREKSLRGPNCFIAQVKKEKLKLISIDSIDESTIKPSIGFFFVHVTLSYVFSNDVKDLICELLPTNCKTIILFAHAIILNRNEETFEYTSGNLVGCALLPQIPNVRLSMVTVRDTILEGDIYTEYTQMIEEALRQNHETSICLMLFCNDYGTCMGSHMAQIAYSRLGNNERIVSLSGGVMEDLQTNNETVSSCEPYCVALLITGSIQTWSIVLEECLTRELIEEKLKLFKEQVKLQKHSVGFMFASLDLFNIRHACLTIFKILFPKIPLVGCCGISEFGTDTTIYKAELECSKEWDNKCSTTFMILTYV